MIKIFFLVAVFNDAFSMTPFRDEAACISAMVGLDGRIVAEAYCYSAEIMAPASIYAPELAPLPSAKPGQSA